MGASRYIPNIITLMRPLLTLIFVYCILKGDYISAISMFATICLTDIFDGVAARALAACTRLGALMDVSADLLYVMASLVVLNIKGLAPAWFTAVTALKFVEFAVTSSILNRRVGNKSTWIFDGLGRWFSALAFISPGVFCIAAMYPGAFQYVVYSLLVISCALAVSSSAARVVRCGMAMKSRY
jgi:CDP-diacylglycerol--glycerol-3-phosphate 3-phosphatidyltransferase